MKTDPVIQKGDHVILRNGWEAEILDGYKSRPTRLAKVYGFVTEMGSVYTRDIGAVIRDGKTLPVTVQ